MAVIEEANAEVFASFSQPPPLLPDGRFEMTPRTARKNVDEQRFRGITSVIRRATSSVPVGFFGKVFGARTTCPLCGSRYARETFGGIKCPTPDCANYERASASRQAIPPAAATAPPPPGRPEFQHRGPPVRFQDPVDVRYVNFRGEARVFTAERSSLRMKGLHVSLRVAPTGRRIALRLDRIANRAEVQALLPPTGSVPTAREQRVLRYHQRRGSTSALYEKLRANHPNWRG